MSTTDDCVIIDGSQGEGGGQILRTSLALSVLTGRPLRIENIRAARKKPGLMRQHLTCVRAAQAVGAAEVEGAELGSTSVAFFPQSILGGHHEFSIGGAGSTTLVLQTILPPLLQAGEASTVVIRGGTHNPMAPSFDFLDRVFAPILRRMGVDVTMTLLTHGFFPAGGGAIKVAIKPVENLRPFEILSRGAIQDYRGRILVSKIPGKVMERERSELERSEFWPKGRVEEVHVEDSPGPGNVVSLEVGDGACRELVTSYGSRGLRAEAVARRALKALKAYLDVGAPVGEHLADQLLIPMALARGGAFVCGEPSLHTRTNATVISNFLPAAFGFHADGRGRTLVSFEHPVD